MDAKVSKPNSDLAFLNARLDAIQMTGSERLNAKASLARADAFADLIIGIFHFFKRLPKTLTVRPIGRSTKLAR